MTQRRKPARTSPLSAEEVRDWLTDNPDFIHEYAELLAQADLPQRDLGAGVIDLQSAQIRKLRADLSHAHQNQSDLIATGRSNLASQGRIHECVLAMLSATSFEQLVQTVTTDFAVRLDVDLVAMCIEHPDAANMDFPLRGVRVIPEGTVAALLPEGRPVVLHSHVAEGDVTIYGGGAPLVASQALARLSISQSAPPGLIAFGSRQPDRFEAGQAVELLSFLARAIEGIFRLWLGRS